MATALLKSIIWTSLIVLGIGAVGLISEELWLQPLCFIPSVAYVDWHDEEPLKTFRGHVRDLIVMAVIMFLILSVLKVPAEQGIVYWFIVVGVWTLLEDLFTGSSFRPPALAAEGEPDHNDYRV